MLVDSKRRVSDFLLIAFIDMGFNRSQTIHAKYLHSSGIDANSEWNWISHMHTEAKKKYSVNLAGLQSAEMCPQTVTE